MEDLKGPYIAYEYLKNEISFSISIGLFTMEEGTKDFQISISILDIAIAIGWKF